MAQAIDQMFAVKQRIARSLNLRRVRCYALVVLPFITRAEWLMLGLPEQPKVLFKDELAPVALRARLEAEAQHFRQRLSPEQWSELRGVFGAKVLDSSALKPRPAAPASAGEIGSKPILEPNPKRPKSRFLRSLETHTKTVLSPEPNLAPSATTSFNPPAVRPEAPQHPRNLIRAAASGIGELDRSQLAVTLMTPPGPQRLRGLAGSGKTVILAKRIAHLHARRPDLELAFVFTTKSLSGPITDRIRREFRAITGRSTDPDWERLRVWHAWGGANDPGFYHHLCHQTGEAFERFGGKRGLSGHGFSDVCDRLEHKLLARPVAPAAMFDALFIDEGQDLPPSFYRLALASLRQPKRLTWAYDAAQSGHSLLVPEASGLFGRTAAGTPLVDLRGVYEGGAPKSLTLRRSYRTPGIVIMAAQAVNCGLFRQGGAIQGMTNRRGWRAIGYELLHGDFTRAGQRVRMRRSVAAGTHPYDADQHLRHRVETIAAPLRTQAFAEPQTERQFILESLRADLALGFAPEDLLVVALDDGFGSRRYLEAFSTRQFQHDFQKMRPVKA